MKARIISIVLSLAMLLSLVPTAVFAADGETGVDPIVYVSIGDSMTNGYGLDGYDGESGIVNYAHDTYSNQFAAWLAGYTGEITDDQVIFTGDNGTVDHRQLAMSGMRAEDLHWLLKLDYTDEELIEKVVNVYIDEYNSGALTWENYSKIQWFGELGFKTGDFRTYVDLTDGGYRLGDGAAKILATYFGENGKGYGYYESDYDYSAYVQNAVDGLAASTYYPNKDQTINELGRYKYLQIAAEFYQKSVKDADIISLALGNSNFGTYMLTEIMDVVMEQGERWKTRFPSRYDLENVFALADLEPEMEAKVRGLITECTPIINEVFGGLTSDPERAAMLEYIVTFCIASYVVNYIGAIETILDLNPDVEIIQVALMNAYAEEGDENGSATIGNVVDLLYTPVNAFIAALPTYLQATGNYTEAEFYYAEADSVACLVDVFGNDFYKKDGAYVAYKGLLTGEEGYEANRKSIVRDRFVENIVRGQTFDMLGSFGVVDTITVEQIADYDLMTPVEKAQYAAAHPVEAKSIAMYLAFENATIRAGKGNVTLKSLAALNGLGVDTFAAPMAVFYANVGEAGKAYIDDAAVVVAAGIDALDADDIEALYVGNGSDDAIYAVVAGKSGGQLTKDGLAAVYANVVAARAAAESNGADADAAEMTVYFNAIAASIGQQVSTVEYLFNNNNADVVAMVVGLKTAYASVNMIKAGYATIAENVDNLCYLLALPQTLGDAMADDATVSGMLCMNARALIGTGIGGHPSKDGHDALYAAVKNTYEDEYTSEQETVKNLAWLIANYYDEAYAYAYAYVKENGYIDEAIGYLEAAKVAVEDAKAAVDGYAVDKQLKGVKTEMLNELSNTVATLDELIALLRSDELATVETALAAALELEDDLWAHLETLKALGLEMGFVVDPYLVKLNDAVVSYANLVDTTAKDAYSWMCNEVDGFVAAYEAWVEEVGVAVDTVSPELGAAVRKFLIDVPADSLAILAAYGEEAVIKLMADAAAAAGDIAGVIATLADVMVKHGETIYNAVKENKDVQALVAEVKDQLVKAEALAEEIADYAEKHPITSVTGTLAKKEALLKAAYGELVVLYNKLYDVTLSAVADVDPIAAEALSDALDALTEILAISCDAAEGYLGWLAGHTEAMGAALLAALLDNIEELLTTACPIIDQMIWNLIAQIEAAIPGIIDYLVDALIAFLPIADQWMYDWLYNHPYEVIAFFTEYGDEIAALAEEYGDEVVGILAYIAYTYGPEVLDFIINNPCEALDMFMDWYNKYGYRIWPMIDVYLEALGVYDAIDEQLETVKAMLSELDAHILAQIAALTAALKDASDELRAEIEAEIQALYEQLMAFLKANISAYYVVGPNSYYVALGDAGAYGPAADLLAAELGMTNKFANLTIENATASDVLAALDAAEIAKADLITLGFGATPIIDDVITDVTNIVFGEVSEKDWVALVGEEGAAAIAAALVEMGNYVMEQTGDEMVAAVLPVVVESFAYTYINHLVDYAVVSEAIHEINADALLVLVGMHNPMDGVVVALNEETELDLGEYLNYLVMLTNIYSFGYALIAEDTIYVDAPAVETNYDGAVMDIMAFVSDLLGFEEAVVKYQPTDAGYKYIQEQIYNALNPTLAEEEEACQHGAPKDDKVNFKWAGDYSTCVAVYTCSICGETLTKDCLVEILETKQPTVEEEGYVKYQASVEIAGVTHTDTQFVVLAKLPAPDTGDNTAIGLYVVLGLLAAAGAVVVLKKKKTA